MIGSDLGNTGSLIEDGVSGFKFEPRSVKSLSEAVEKINRSFTGLERTVIEKYSTEKNYQKLREIYETCCNHH